MMISKKVIWAMLLILLSPAVYAIGISPSTIEIWYEPNKELSYDYFVKINGQGPQQAVMYTKGDINESITLEKTFVELQPDVWTKFSFKIKFPPTLSPGLHDNRVGIVESSGPNIEGGIGVIAGVESVLLIRSAYPGRYLTLEKFEIPTGEVNKPIELTIELRNLGEEGVNDARARIDIKNSAGEVVTALTTEGVSIKQKETGVLKTQWQTSTPGVYSATGIVIYDENRLELPEQTFNVGELTIEITNTSAPPVLKGEIAKVYADIKSIWNSEIKDVYAELEVKGQNGLVVGKSESPTVNIPPWSTKNLVLYWDSKEMEIGEYQGKITLHYAGKTDEELVMIKIRNPSIFLTLKENMLLTAGIAVVVALLLFNIIFLFKKKKKRKQDK